MANVNHFRKKTVEVAVIGVTNPERALSLNAYNMYSALCMRSLLSWPRKSGLNCVQQFDFYRFSGKIYAR